MDEINEIKHNFTNLFITINMKKKELEEKLTQLKIEDFIWIIYIGIIFLSWYSNNLERDYFINENINSKEKYRKIIIFIFSILNIVYFYFLQDSQKSIQNLNPSSSKKRKELTYLSYIASYLISISGILFLIIAISDTDMNVELAFN